jgi:polyhydroxyalkanoic acid synthase PhaR subunit
VSNETRDALDPAALWQQWYDTATAAWTKAVRGEGERFASPFSLYRDWMKGVETARAQSSDSAAQATPRPTDLWKQWFEATARAWEATAGMGADALGLTTQWTEMLEEARAKLLAGESLPMDPLSFFIQWYNATSEVWSKAVADLIGTEAFVAVASRFLESYTSYARTFRHISEEYFSALQLATRPDIARVAKLVVALEDKVDHLEEEIDGFSDDAKKLIKGGMAQGEALASLERRLAHLQAALGERVQLAHRIDQMEQQLDQMETALGQVQGTLQRVLAAVEKPPIAPPAEKEAPGEERKTPSRRAAASGPAADQA